MEKNKKRLLFIDDHFHPELLCDSLTDSEKRDDLKKIVKFLKKKYEIGLKDIPDYAKCQPRDCGISVYHTTRYQNGDEISTFDYPSGGPQREDSDTNMFFSTDGAYRYFKRFTSNDDLERLEALTRLDEMDTVIMDICMPPGTCLQEQYPRKRIDDKNAGFWLTHFLGEQVATQNPNAILPVLMLTSEGDIGRDSLPGITHMSLGKQIMRTDPKRMLADLDTLIKARVR